MTWMSLQPPVEGNRVITTQALSKLKSYVHKIQQPLFLQNLPLLSGLFIDMFALDSCFMLIKQYKKNGNIQKCMLYIVCI